MYLVTLNVTVVEDLDKNVSSNNGVPTENETSGFGRWFYSAQQCNSPLERR